MPAKTVKINVEGMSCGHCSGMVQRTLEEIDGISNICVDLEGKSAQFDVTDEKVVDTAVRQVTEAGYQASV